MALGGLGEIGRNMAVLEYAGRLLVIDCGVLFPEAEQPGVDLILPDFGVIEHRLDDIEAVVLTHGHEDHIGAVPYLLRASATSRWSAPGSRWRWSRRSCASTASSRRWSRSRRATTDVAGPFDCEFFAVNHSIPDALAVAIRTPAGRPGAHRRLQDGPAAAGRRAHRPRRLRPARRGGHRPAAVRLDQRRGARLRHARAQHRPGAGRGLRAGATRRVIVACFASHVHRVQQVLDCAETHGRKVAFVGRSMVRNMGVARDLGLLHVPPGLMVSLDEAAAMPPEQVVLVSTGSQGEPLSALARMAKREHQQVRIEAGDTVVLASSLVPGNETAVYRVINGLARQGAHGRAQGDRAGARLRARAGRRAALPAQRRPSRATSCRCTASGGTCGRTPSWPS